ncbi:hypothetical protein [uncultured Celeribacter sp.]|uniref:hypothetical protein n=1 Tax=uncultured Celeribacter sp. TaxID=1303376 RepID=UPI002AA89F3D|nr:hypothetical protein [uncultured Celeribacter sp.]
MNQKPSVVQILKSVPKVLTTDTGQRMRCLKAFGEQIAASDPDRQTAKPPNRRNRGELRVAHINRFNALGTAEIVRVARTRRGKGKSRLKPPFCKMPIHVVNPPRPELCNNAHPMAAYLFLLQRSAEDLTAE